MKALLLTLLLMPVTTQSATPAKKAATEQTAATTKQSIVSSVTNSLSHAWQWCVDVFYGVLHKLGMRKTLPLLKNLYATRAAREKNHAKRYVDLGIPEKVSQIAGVLDRMEEDFTACRMALKAADDDATEASLYDEIKRIDDAVDDYMDKMQPVVDEYEELAFKKRDTDLIKFMQVLQSRSFLEQMLDD